MQKIEVKVLNNSAITDSENMLVAMARMTQRGHNIANMEDFMKLYNKPYTKDLVGNLVELPHPTLQKFGTINIAIIGASRRFLGQITRHQNECKFMSGSLQYSDYSGKAQFCVPYEIIMFDEKTREDGEVPRMAEYYLNACTRDLEEYEELAALVGRDAAGYKMPQGMRNVLVISATPFQWKHMIRQRICHRNSPETRYVMLRAWEELYDKSLMFVDCNPDCCNEGGMSCKDPIVHMMPSGILNKEFKYIRSK